MDSRSLSHCEYCECSSFGTFLFYFQDLPCIHSAFFDDAPKSNVHARSSGHLSPFSLSIWSVYSISKRISYGLLRLSMLMRPGDHFVSHGLESSLGIALW